jgi:hypothetical protein
MINNSNQHFLVHLESTERQVSTTNQDNIPIIELDDD